MGDIDGQRHRVHIRGAKGGKDRYVPLPVKTLGALRRYWSTHRNPVFLFPNRTEPAQATQPMDRGGIQAAMKAAVSEYIYNLSRWMLDSLTESTAVQETVFGDSGDSHQKVRNLSWNQALVANHTTSLASQIDSFPPG